MAKRITQIAAALLTIAAILGSLLASTMTSAAPTTWEPFQYLKQHGITKLENGKTYDIGHGYSMRVEAKNGLGTLINIDLVEDRGKWINPPHDQFTGIFAKKARGNAATIQSADPEGEDANILLTIIAGPGLPPLKLTKGRTLDNDPKDISSGTEDGAVFTTAQGAYPAPKSPPNTDNEVAEVEINQQVSWFQFTSQDSWHFAWVAQTETVATPTPKTSTPSPSPSPSPSPTSTTPNPACVKGTYSPPFGENPLRETGIITVSNPHLVRSGTITWNDGSAPESLKIAGVINVAHTYTVSGTFPITVTMIGMNNQPIDTSNCNGEVRVITVNRGPHKLYLPLMMREDTPPPPPPDACNNVWIPNRAYSLTAEGYKLYTIGAGTVVQIWAQSNQNASVFNWWKSAELQTDHDTQLEHFVRGSGKTRIEARLPSEGATVVSCHILVESVPGQPNTPTPETPPTDVPPTDVPTPEPTERPTPQVPPTAPAIVGK
jgi:hypothetical protein